jgi:HEAT repeat protein
MSRVFVAQLVVVCVFAVCAISQQQALGFDGQPETAKEALTRRHIETTAGLLKALRSNDPEVRQLAAAVLADDGIRDAIPAVREAFDSETVPGNRVNMALFLAQLGDMNGREYLSSVCKSDGESVDIKMLAAINMRYLRDDSCMDTVFTVLRSPSVADAPARTQAVYLSLDFAPSHPQDVLDLLTKSLRDPDSGVRMAASSALQQLGSASAIPYLRTALETEQNEGCRLSMGLAIQRLESKKGVQ